MKTKIIMLPRQPQPSFGLGAIAGNSVPATATAAGYFYVISSAGTSQSITWAVGDWAVYNGTSGSWTKVPFASPIDITAYANLVNGRAAQGALAFDGTTNCRATATLTGQDIGTGDFSFVWLGWFPTGSSDAWLIAAGPATTELMGGAGGAAIYVTAAGHLQFGLQSSGGYEYKRVANARTTYGGKETLIIGTRTGSTWKIYINGVDQTLTAGDTSASVLANSITSTYLATNFRGTNYSTGYVGKVSKYALYNLCLSQADVTEIMENGGEVPFRYQFGSQTNRISDTSRNASFTAAATDWSSSGLSGGTTTLDDPNNELDVSSDGTNGAGTGLSASNADTFTRGKVYRLSATISNYTGAQAFNARLDVNDVFFTGFSISGNGTTSGIATAGASHASLAIRSTGAGSATSFSITAISVQQVGAVAHYDADLDGIGYQLHDQSTNKLDALITTTGASWTKPARRGYVRASYTWPGTHEGKNPFGQRMFPANVVIDLITTKATAASTGSGMHVGTSNSFFQWVNASPVTVAKKIHTIYSRLPAGSADGDLNLDVDPDTNNYTGTIQLEIQYTTTEG